MPHKSKLPPELKIKIVEDYLAGRIGKAEAARKYDIPNSTLRDWVYLYQSQGPQGLTPRSRCASYSAELKQQVVEEYLAGKGSLVDLCKKYVVNDSKVIRNWIKKYYGHEDLKASSGGGSEIYMTSGRTTNLEERIEAVEFCISHGKDYKAAIDKYGVSYQQIYAWVRKYEEQGVNGLQDRRGKRKDVASMTEVERLQAELKLKEAENRRLQIENELLKKLDEVERRRYLAEFGKKANTSRFKK